MKNTYLTLYLLSFIFTQIINAQIVDDCYSQNKKEYEKLDYNHFQDKYLKSKIHFYFSIEESLTEPKSFIKTKPYLCTKTKAKVKSGNDYEFEISTTRFEVSHHSILKKKGGYICRIDNNIFFGTDDELPREEISGLKVKYKNLLLVIPKIEYTNLFNPDLSNTGKYDNIFTLKDTKSNYVMLVLNGSDGAGSYVAMWIFKDGKYIRRIVDRNEG